MPTGQTSATSDEPIEAPVECGHKDWVFGCERCWFEVEALVNDKVRAQTMEAQMEGAVLFNWYVMLVLQDIERQLQTITRTSLDLHRVELSKDIIANIKQIGLHLVAVVANPDKLAKAMAQAAQLAVAMNTEMAKADRKAAPQQTRSSIVLTDGL